MSRRAAFACGGLALALLAGLWLTRSDRSQRTSAVASFRAEEARQEQLSPPLAVPRAASVEREERVELPAPVEAPAAASSALIAGRVRDEDGVPVAQASVHLRQPSRRNGRESWKITTTGTTDADGRFRFEGVARQLWNLQVSGDELLEASELTVDASGGDRDVELVVRRGHELFVRARWVNGSLAENVSFGLKYAEGGKGLGGERGRRADGVYVIRGLFPGEHEVRASAELDGRIGRGVAHAHVPDPAVLEIVLEEATIVLRGRVVDPEGRPIQGVRVTVSAADLSFHVNATTSSDGTFELRGLEAGPVSLHADAQGKFWPEKGAGERKLELEPGMPPIEIVLVPTGLVRGQVLDAAGQPVAGARVLGGGGIATFEEQSTDADGRFAVPVAPGRRILYATAKGHANSLNEVLELAGGEVLEGIVLRLRPACRVVGRVLDANGQPAPGVTLFAGHGRTVADKHGEFVFANLSPEPITLQADDDDDGFARQTVTPLPEQETRVELRFLPRSPLHAHLSLREHGQPVDGDVFLTTQGFFRTTSSQDGRLELALQTPGVWRGVFTRSGAERDDFAAQRLFELAVPGQDPWQAMLELELLSAPTGKTDVGEWLR